MATPLQYSNVNLQDNRGPEIVKAVAIPAALAATAVACRLISRRLKHLELKASDYTIIIGLLGAWAAGGGLIAGKTIFYLSNCFERKFDLDS